MTRAVETDGWMQTVASLLVGAAVAAIVAVSAWSNVEIAGRLAIIAVVILALALVVGSAWLVGAASIPLLAAALISSGSQSEPAWIQTLLVGCLWYVALELAWDAIDRRAGGPLDGLVARVRIHEVSTVVVVAFGVGVVGLVATEVAPDRDLIAQAPILVGLLLALGAAIRHLRRTVSVGAGE